MYIEKVRKKSLDMDYSGYPYTIPSIAAFQEIEFTKPVTFFVGENGMGKSTLIEALAVLSRFNPEGGSRGFNFHTRESHSELYNNLILSRGYKIRKDGYFLRAESFYNVATELENLKDSSVLDAYGGKWLHDQSHGESFMALLMHRFFGRGLYILDEPEAALSPAKQLQMLSRIHQLVQQDSQFIIATHSPIIMAYPDAEIYLLDESGINTITYQDTSHYKIFKYFLNNPSGVLTELFQ